MIDGTKAFITNSGTPITSLVTVTALTGPGEISTILVPAGTTGFEVQPAYRKMGWHASDTHGLTFVECRVPEDHLLGERGRGSPSFLEILDDGRIAIAALAVGVLAALPRRRRRLRRRTARRSVVRSDRTRPWRSVAPTWAVARRPPGNLVYHAAWLRDHGKPFKTEAATAKLFATEAAIDATRPPRRCSAASASWTRRPCARHYRDAKILEIGEGTSEVQRLLIARDLGLRV